MNINEDNYKPDGVTSEEEFTKDEKKVQYSEPECFPIEQSDLPSNSAGKKLTKKQIAFCRYYISTGDVARSATLAGYGKPGGAPLATVGRALFLNKDVKAFIAELAEKNLANMGYNKNDMIKTLAIIANHDVREYLNIETRQSKQKDGTIKEYKVTEFKDLDDVNKGYATDEYGFDLTDEDGNPIKIDTGKTKAIKSIKMNDSGKIVMEFYDKMTAIEKLSKMLGVDGKTQIEVTSSEKVENAKASLLDKLNKKLGNEPNVKVAAEDNEWYKQKQEEKRQAELFNQGLEDGEN